MSATDLVRVIVDRWQVTYHVPPNAAAAQEACDRLTASIETDVAAACASVLSRHASHDPSVILIRRLDLNLNLALSDATIPDSARHWGEQVASAIQQTIVSDESEDVMRFPDRGAYIARFALDLAQGRAWGKWYYSEFDTLRALATSKAICEALTREPSHTASAVGRLMEFRGLHTVLDTLTSRDAETVFRRWHDHAGASPQSATRVWIDRLLDYAADLPFRASRTGDHAFHDGLWWATLAANQDAAAGEPSLLGSIDALLAARRVLFNLPISARSHALQLLADRNVDAAYALALRHGAADSHEILARLADHIDGDLQWAQRVEGALFGEQDYVRRTANLRLIPRGPAIPSPHAGIFRLGPSFKAALEPALILPTLEAAMVRHAIALACLGSERAVGAANDPVVRLFSGWDGEWQQPADADAIAIHAQRVLKHFQRRLIGLERSSPRHIYDNVLAGTGFVRDNVETIEVELPAPPLAVLLRLAGILEEDYALPWLTTPASEEKIVWLRQLVD